MKKFISIGASIILLICVMLSSTSCAFGDPFNKFSKKIEKEKSYKVTMSINMDDVGKVTQIFYVDDNVIYYPENDTLHTDAYYVEEIDDYLIEYTQTKDDKWQKSITENDVDPEENDIFNKENYIEDDEEKGVYRQKKSVIFENFDDVVISFVDDTIVIECVMTVDFVDMDAKMVISNIGEYELELPEVE